MTTRISASIKQSPRVTAKSNSKKLKIKMATKPSTNMNEVFQRDAFLYAAFLMLGWATIASTVSEKLIIVAGAVATLVLRSLVKKYLEK